MRGRVKRSLKFQIISSKVDSMKTSKHSGEIAINRNNTLSNIGSIKALSRIIIPYRVH